MSQENQELSRKVSDEIVNAPQNTNLTIATTLNVNFFESESDKIYQMLLNKNLKMCKESAKGSVNEIIKICVGGQDFKTTLGTLMSDQNSMLAKMFESDLLGRVATARDPDTSAYFIDRSPKYFESILNFLRTGEIECPCCLDLKFLLQEADYYGIEG